MLHLDTPAYQASQWRHRLQAVLLVDPKTYKRTVTDPPGPDEVIGIAEAKIAHDYRCGYTDMQHYVGLQRVYLNTSSDSLPTVCSIIRRHDKPRSDNEVFIINLDGRFEINGKLTFARSFEWALKPYNDDLWWYQWLLENRHRVRETSVSWKPELQEADFTDHSKWDRDD